MGDRASDTSEAPALPKRSDGDTLERAGQDILALLRQAAAVTEPGRQGVITETQGSVTSQGSVTVVDRLPLEPREIEARADVAADLQPGDGSPDTLELLRKLAHKSSNDRRAPRIEAVQSNALQPPAALPPSTSKRRIALFTIFGCLAASAAGVGTFFWSQMPASDNKPQAEANVPAPAAVPSAPAAAPTVPAIQTRTEVSSVQTAMTECDSEAAKNPFLLYFLVTTVAPGSNAAPSTQSKEANDSYTLVPSSTMLDGLRDHSLTLYSTPFRYAISDSATGKIKTWNSPTGMYKFVHDDTTAYSKFRVAVDVAGLVPKWSEEYARRTGVCYWVNVRVPRG